MAIYLVRHAHAGTRGRYSGPDSERPLSDRGQVQAKALAQALADAPVSEVRTSPAVRCLETVDPLAEARGLEVVVDDALTEGCPVRATTRLVWELASTGTDAVLCSHGDVIPAALDALAADGVAVEDKGLPKGTYYRLEVDGDGSITSATFVDPRP